MEMGRRPSIPHIRHTPSIRCDELRLGRRLASIVMAGPFFVCFALFGVFNLVAGTVLIVMAAKPRSPSSFWNLVISSDEFQKVRNNLLDPLKIVGPILLITGAMLVLVGLVLGTVACRSVNSHSGRSYPALSYPAIPLTAVNGPSSHPSVAVTMTSDLIPKRTQSLTVPTIEVHSPAGQSPVDRKKCSRYNTIDVT